MFNNSTTMSFEIPEAWKGLYPQVPKDLDREPFVNLIPICVFALSLALLVTVVISVKAKKKYAFFLLELIYEHHILQAWSI